MTMIVKLCLSYDVASESEITVLFFKAVGKIKYKPPTNPIFSQNLDEKSIWRGLNASSIFVLQTQEMYTETKL